MITTEQLAPVCNASSVGDLLFDAAGQYADRALIEFRGRAISFAEMAAAAENIAAALADRGVAKGDIVALYFPNTPHYPAVFFAAMRLGATIVNLTPLDAPRELRFKLADTGARVLATLDQPSFGAHGRALLDEGLIDLLLLGSDEFWIGGDPSIAGSGQTMSLDTAIATNARCPAVARASDDLALIQYTGGTTGTPKGAMISHGNLLSAVAMFDAAIAAGSAWRPGTARHIGVLPLFHIYALAGVLLRAVASGETIMLRDRFDAEQVLDDIGRGGATFFFGVPTMFIALLEHPDIESFDLSSLTLCVSGGAPLPGEVANRMAALVGSQPVVGWGMTETCGAGTLGRVGDRSPAGAIGYPLPGASIVILGPEDERNPVAPGTVGEIAIAGPHIFGGYWNRPDESASAFTGDYLRTGDMGFADADGQIHLVDRMKDLIISSGFNVYPRVVEDAIYEHPAVAEAIVFGAPDSYRGEIAVAAVKLRPGVTLTLGELRAFLSDKLGRHELPARLELHDALPRTAAGKLSRKELRDAFAQKAGDHE